VSGLSRGLSAEDVFRLHPKIRWTAFSVDGKVVFCEMRVGLQSYTSDAEDRAFMELGPFIMSGVAERLTASGGAGRLESVVVNLEKDSVLLTRVGSGYLAVSVDRVDAYSVFQEIEPLLRGLR